MVSDHHSIPNINGDRSTTRMNTLGFFLRDSDTPLLSEHDSWENLRFKTSHSFAKSKLPKQHSNESLHLTSTKNKQNTLTTVQQELNNFTQTQSRGGTFLQSQERLKQRLSQAQRQPELYLICLSVFLSIKFKIRTSETKPKAPRLILIRKFCHPST